MGSTPLTLRCPKCKKGRKWESNEHGPAETLSSTGLKRTGVVKFKRRYHAWHDVELVQMKHDIPECGHVFFTTHPNVTINPHRYGAPGA